MPCEQPVFKVWIHPLTPYHVDRSALSRVPRAESKRGGSSLATHGCSRQLRYLFRDQVPREAGVVQFARSVAEAGPKLRVSCQLHKPLSQRLLITCRHQVDVLTVNE